MRTFVGPPGPLGRLGDAIRRRLGRAQRVRWQPTEETLRVWEDIQAVPASPLVAVVGVGRSVAAAGITVELLSVEIRGAGAILRWRAHPEEPVLLLGAFVSVTDATGTRYRVSGGGDGSPGSWQGETVVLPAPPGGARLSITLERFGPPDDRPLPPGLVSDAIAGPWQFAVDVPATPDRAS